jgi:putative FmdB family regulatory protein
MASYTYECPECKEKFVVYSGMNEKHSKECPKCKVESKRIYSPTTSIWKCEGSCGSFSV